MWDKTAAERGGINLNDCVLEMAPAKALAGLLVPTSLDSGRGQLGDCKNK